MAKTKVSEYDATAANNTDIDSINIAEGMAPSNVNNAIRQLMAHLKTEFFKTGSNNTSLGDTALDSLDGSSPGGSNTAIGSGALTANTTANNNTAVGYNAMSANTTGTNNVAFGALALDANTTASNNTALGYNVLSANTTGNNNVAVGTSALDALVAGDKNIAIGVSALGSQNTSSGADTYNTAIGHAAGAVLTSGTANTIIGGLAGDAMTTGANNVIVGYLTGSAVTTGQRNTYIGRAAGQVATTGNDNTFIGDGAGSSVTTGSGNTIIGDYSGNEGGLDIRTSSNNIVLSDGDGNPRVHIDSSGRLGIAYTGPSARLYVQGEAGNDTAVFRNGSDAGNGISIQNAAGTEVGSINWASSSTSFNTSSDYRLKENVVDLTGATDRLKQLEPKRFNFIADADTTVDGFLAHEVSSIVPEAITGTHNEVDDDGNPVYQGIDQSKLVPLLVATIKELEARITTLENA